MQTNLETLREKQGEFNTELAVYLLAFLVALMFHFIRLGQAPLSDAEATLALQAWNIAAGERPILGPQPLYVVLTSVLFAVFQAGNWAARFWPALAASGLVWVAYLNRHWLGRKPALLAAFFFAFDPVVAAAARQAGGHVLALVLLLLTLSFWVRRNRAWTGIFAGLALLSGPSIWLGGIILVIALLWNAILCRRSAAQRDAGSEPVGCFASLEDNRQDTTSFLRGTLPWLAGSVALVGTLFLAVPGGLSALGSGLVAFGRSWSPLRATPVGLVLVGLLAYENFAIILAVMGLIRSPAAQRPLEHFLWRWLLVALPVILLFPSRQPLDLLWAVPALGGLAARQLARWMDAIPVDRAAVLAKAALVFALLVFMALNFAAMSNLPAGSNEMQLRWLSIAGSAILLLLVTVMVAWGWSVEIATGGLSGGLFLALLLFTFSASWRAAGLGSNPAAEVWQPTPTVAQDDLLAVTIGDLSEWNSGSRSTLDLKIVNLESPALTWLLRDHRTVQNVAYLEPDANTPLVITPDSEQVASSAAYTGQDFILRQRPAWDLMLPGEWRDWLLFRRVGQEEESIILWVRSDLFPAAQGSNFAQP